MDQWGGGGGGGGVLGDIIVNYAHLRYIICDSFPVVTGNLQSPLDSDIGLPVPYGFTQLGRQTALNSEK